MYDRVIIGLIYTLLFQVRLMSVSPQRYRGPNQGPPVCSFLGDITIKQDPVKS